MVRIQIKRIIEQFCPFTDSLFPPNCVAIIFFEKAIVFPGKKSFLCIAKIEAVCYAINDRFSKVFNSFRDKKSFKWSVHLRVRIQDFHSCHRGSNPLQTTSTI